MRDPLLPPMPEIRFVPTIPSPEGPVGLAGVSVRMVTWAAWDRIPAEDWRSIGEAHARYLKARERQEVAAMPDGLLSDHLDRLRRVLVMADEDGLPNFLRDLARERFELAQREMNWRKRAEQKGGPALARGDWRERIEHLKLKVDLAELIANECDGARPAGLGKWVCCCPFHPDRNPSLSIDVQRGLWKCHGCGVGGDCFTYVELRFGLDFAAAVRHLEARL